MIITEMQVKRKHGAESFNQLPKTYDDDSNGDVIMSNLPKKVFLSVRSASWFYISFIFILFFCSILVVWDNNMSSIWFYLQTEAEEQGSWTVPWNEYCHVRKQEATWAVSNCSTSRKNYDVLYSLSVSM